MTLTPGNGVIPHDYHMHSNASPDSQATMVEMGRAALGMGIGEIAFTEHFDLHPHEPTNTFYRPDRYFEKLGIARHALEPEGLTLRAGVELGEPHRFQAQQQAVLDAYPYDVVLGSLHWVGDDLMFDEGFFRSRTPRDAVTLYFTELAVMVRAGGFDVLAHADVFKRVAYDIYHQFDIAEWEDLVRPVWQACIDQGIGIEINTASLRRAVNEVHPAPPALRWYREMGGERLTLGSDAHRPQHVGYGLAQALEIARDAGFTRLAHYERRQITRWDAI